MVCYRWIDRWLIKIKTPIVFLAKILYTIVQNRRFMAVIKTLPNSQHMVKTPVSFNTFLKPFEKIKSY